MEKKEVAMVRSRYRKAVEEADNDAEKEIQLFANLCELTPENLLDLDMADYSKLQKAYQDFLS